MAIKVIKFNKHVTLIGKSIKVYLKKRPSDKGGFNFYVDSYGRDWIGGHDDEGLDLRINTKDIDFIIGG